MHSLKSFRFICFILLIAMYYCVAEAEDFTNAIQAHLLYYVHTQVPHGCIVVGLVDEHGTRVISCGDLDNGTDRQADGNTVFVLESASYTFFHLLLQDAVERGEMQPEDPVEKYLPPSVKMPAYHGKPITLRHLAKETSGLNAPLGDVLDPKRFDAPFEGLTAEKLYALVSKYQLTSEPGTTHSHGGMGRGVLNQAVALRAGMDFESLLTVRLLGPLDMKDTVLSPTPEMESHFAPEHSRLGWTMPRWKLEEFPPLGGVFSTANDLLKMLSACSNTSSRLSPLWDNARANFAFAPPRRAGMLHTGGGWYVNGSFIAFDKVRRRGVVVLANAYEPRHELGLLLLDSEWKSDQRPQPARLSSDVSASFAGKYRRSPSYALGKFVISQYLLNAPRTATVLPAGLCPAILAVLLWRTKNPRKRRFILGGLVVVAIFAALLPALASRVFCARLHPGIGIRCEGDRLFAEPTGSGLCAIEEWPIAKAWGQKVQPIDVLFPPMPVEFLPESETQCFERLSGVPMTFARDTQGKVISLTLHYRGQDFIYDKTSEEPPKAPEPVKPPVIVNLNTNALDACTGQYEVAPDGNFPKGMKVMVWCEGGQLFGRVHPSSDYALLGTFPLYPVSETNCYEKLTGAEFRFTRNDRGQVTALTHHNTGATISWFSDWEAKKLK